jgi:hypothetical protein
MAAPVTVEVTTTGMDETLIDRLKASWGVRDTGEVIKRSLAIAEFLQLVSDQGLDELFVRSSARPDLDPKRLEINHFGKFSLKIVPAGR